MRIIIFKRIINSLMIMALIHTLVVLSGCSVLPKYFGMSTVTSEGYSTESSVDGMERNGERIDLSKVVGVVPFYQIADSSQPATDRSQVGFIYTDGSYKIIDNSFMFGNRAAWTTHGLFYSDRKYDYFISNKTNALQVTPHKKTDFQYTTYPIDESHALTMYNKGIGENDNSTLSVSSTNGVFKEVSFTQGDSNIIGENISICENGNSYDIATNDGDSDNPTTAMYQLSSGAQPLFKKVQEIRTISQGELQSSPGLLEVTHHKPVFGIMSSSMPSNPCIANWIYSIVEIGRNIASYDSNPRGFAHAVLRWNVETGEHDFTVLKDSKDHIIYTHHGDPWAGIQLTTNSLQGNELTILDYDTGTIAVVDMTTGRMQEISELLAPKELQPIGKVFTTCSENYIYQTWIPINDNLGKHSYINMYSRHSHKLVKSFKIDDELTKYQQTESIQPGYMVLNPTLLLEKDLSTK